MEYWSIADIKKSYAQKSTSSREYLQAVKNKISRVNPMLNAFITLTDEENPQTGSLLGIPYSVKDVFCTKDILTTAGSKMLAEFVPPYSATVYERISAQGGAILGKNNCDEFAQGATGEYSAFGPTLNPWDNSRVAGGSSSGSAAAVAAGLSTFSIGSDTGGSIRLPASYCGVVGFKPSYGMISRYGLIAMASSLECPGIIARNLDDVQLVFEIISGADEYDHTSGLKNKETRKLRKIGIPQEYFSPNLNPDIKNIINDVIKFYANKNAEVIDINLPTTKYVVPAYYIIVPAEVSSNLARYDGIAFGGKYQQEDQQSAIDEMRSNLFGAEVKRRILVGTFALSEGYIDQYYNQAQAVRRLIINEFEEIFNKVDMLITPVCNHIAPKIGEKLTDPLAMYLDDQLTCAVNLGGVPALSVPAGMANNMPVGVQFISAQGSDQNLIAWAKMFEAEHNWCKLHPDREFK